MKKVTSLLLLTGVAAFGLVGCGDDVVTQPDDPQVLSVTVTPSSVNIEEGETVTLSANVEAEDGADTGVTWSSSNSSVASVDGSGNVTGQSTGSATIIATSNADASKSGAAEVQVTEAGGDRPTISILGIDCEDSIADCEDGDDEPNIAGELDITLNVDEGDQDIAAVQLLLNDEVVREQTFSTNVVGLSTATEGTSNITFTLQTDEAGECTDGSPLTPTFPNGMKKLSARLLLEAGDPETATWDDSLNFNNGNRIEIVHIDGTGMTEVGGGTANFSEAPEGQRFWGHNYMGTGAATDTLHFAACPVVFDDFTVSEIRIDGETDSCCDDKDFDVDFGSGHGALHPDDEAPFQYLARPAPNDSVEDTDGGHVIGENVQVFDDEGEDVTDQFSINELSDFWLDFTAPMEGGDDTPGRIQIDEMDIAMSPARHYTDETADYVLPDGTVLADGDPDGDGIASDYNITGVIDGGVGFDPTVITFDVFHDTTASDGTPVAEDQVGLNDTDGAGDFILTEEGPDTDPDWYYAHVDSLRDFLKNAMATDGISQLDSSKVHGLDRTEPELDVPDDTVIDDGGVVIDDDEFEFEAVDPDLNNDASDPGSGVNDEDCDSDCLWIFATSNDTIDLTVDDDGSAGDETFRVDFGGMVQGPVDFFLSVPDSAFKTPNVATMNFSFIYDTMAPTVGFAGVTGLNSSDADEVTFTVDGSVKDRNGDGTAVTEATIFVTISDDNMCNDADDAHPSMTTGGGLGPAPVSPDTVSVLDQVQANDGDYSQEFVADNTGNSETIFYCFNMQADDGAVTADGADAGHQTVKSASKQFTWNP